MNSKAFHGIRHVRSFIIKDSYHDNTPKFPNMKILVFTTKPLSPLSIALNHSTFPTTSSPHDPAFRPPLDPEAQVFDD